MHRARQKIPIKLFIHRGRLAIQEDNSHSRRQGSKTRQSFAIPSTASRHYCTHTGRGGLAIVVSIKLMEMLYVSWI
jgi:hypothetical protein